MGQLFDIHGNKSAGQLILHTDWNAVVAAVDTLKTNFDAQVQEYETNKQAVSQRLDNLEASLEPLANIPDRVVALESEMAAFKASFRKVNLSTTKVNFLIGEQGVLEAQVTDMFDESVEFEGERPWIDFVASWGLLKPAPGFNSRGGAGERAISVQVNEDGLARVFVRAEHGEGLPEEDEQQVAGALKGRLGNNLPSVAEALLEAETPMEAERFGAFSFLADEYDREAAKSVRHYVDTAYRRYAPLRLVAFPNVPIHTWRDHRATVTAMLKADADPTTADSGQAYSSIQITFRDWIAPFAEIGYLPVFKDQEDILKDTYEANIDFDFIKTMENIKAKTKEFIIDKGWLGRQRNLRAAQKALEKIQPRLENPHLPAIKTGLSDALRLQLAMEALPLHEDLGANIAMEVITNNRSSSNAETGALHLQFAQMSEEFIEISQDVTAIKARDDAQKDLEGQINLLREDLQKAEDKLFDVNDAVIRIDGTKINTEITDLHRKTSEMAGLVESFRLDNETFRQDAVRLAETQTVMTGQLNNLQGLSAIEFSQTIGNVSSLMNRIESLERGGIPRGPE